MPELQRRLKLLHRLAQMCAVLVLAVVSLSAYIRLADGGPGCVPWPQCYGQARASAATPDAPLSGIELARPAHRVIASVVLLAILAVVGLCFIDRPRLWAQGRLALALLLLALALAVLGRYSSGIRVPAIGVSNLLGGLLMFALCVRLVVAFDAPAGATRAAPRAWRAWAWVSMGLLVAQATAGAWVSTSYAGAGCSGWADCGAALRGAATAWLGLGAAPDLSRLSHAAGAGWLGLHHLLAAAVAVALSALAMSLRRSGQPGAALGLMLLLVLQLAAGLALTGGGLGSSLGLALALVHNLLAALSLAWVARLL